MPIAINEDDLIQSTTRLWRHDAKRWRGLATFFFSLFCARGSQRAAHPSLAAFVSACVFADVRYSKDPRFLADGSSA